MKPLFIILIVYSFISSSLGSAATPMEYRYWDLGASHERDKYQYALLALLLNKTHSEFGPYRLLKVDDTFTPSRAARELSRGVIFNIEATPHRPSTGKLQEVAKNKFIMVGPPLLKGLMGYRRLIVRSEDLEKFTKIKSQEELKKLTAGQGRDWADIVIYQDNGYPVSAHATLNNLFSMLEAKRFDYIPLGVIEAENLLKQYASESTRLSIVPNLIIYYPFPVHFNISINYPELATRIDKGLQIALADGSLSELFNQFFSAEIALLKNPDNRIFYLKNNAITNEEELTVTGQIPVNFIY